jgi:hypothetical protein
MFKTLRDAEATLGEAKILAHLNNPHWPSDIENECESWNRLCPICSLINDESDSSCLDCGHDLPLTDNEQNVEEGHE